MATDVSTALPQLDLPPNSTITVTLDDPGATISQLNIHGFQPDSAVAAAPPDPVRGAYLFA